MRSDLKRQKSPVWWLVVPLLLLTTFLGARGLNMDAIWYDEWLSVYYAGGGQYGPVSPDVTWARVAERSTWPPGFQTTLAGWGALVGWDHAATRTLSLLVGVLAVAWMYRLGRDLVSVRAGLSAAVFLGASAFFANYLHELRGYTMYALFSAMCVWSYWRILKGRGGFWTQLTFFLSIVGLLYTHYFATLAAVAVAVYHLLFVPKNRAWWRVPILMALAGLTFLPWVGIAFGTAADAFESERRLIVPLHADKILETLAYSFSNGSVALLGFVGLYSLAYPTTQTRRRIFILAWLWTLVVLAIPIALNERLRVIFHVRHLMAAWPAMALVCALGVEAMARTKLRAALLLSIWMLAGLWSTFDPAFIGSQPGQESLLNWRDFSAVLDTVRAHAVEDDKFVFHVEEPGREWLLEPSIDFYTYPLIVHGRQLEQIPGLEPNNDYYQHLHDFIGHAPHVWLAMVPSVPPSYQVSEFQRLMADDYAACGRLYDGEQMTLDLYARRPRVVDNFYFQFGEGAIGMTLLWPLPEQVDDVLEVQVGWHVTDEVPPDTYSYGLHVTDELGNVVAQVDGGLPHENFSCVNARIDVSALPAGEYYLDALVYNWQTGERLHGRVTDGPGGDSLKMGEFTKE